MEKHTEDKRHQKSTNQNNNSTNITTSENEKWRDVQRSYHKSFPGNYNYTNLQLKMNIYYDYTILYVNDGTKKAISRLETTIQCKTTEQNKNTPLRKNLATERMQKIKRKYIDDNVSEKTSQIFDKNLYSKLTIF